MAVVEVGALAEVEVGGVVAFGEELAVTLGIDDQLGDLGVPATAALR